MAYQIIDTANNSILTEATRINDNYLVQQVRDGLAYGVFQSGEVKLMKNGKEIDPEIVLDKDEKRADDALERKKKTHRQISVIDGVSGFKRKKIWIKK